MKSNKILVYTIITGLLAVLFIPFVVASSQLFPFITGKGFVFRILVEILFGLWVAGIFFDSSIRPKSSWLTWSVIAFTSITLLADIFGYSFYRSFWSNYERMDGFITTLHVAAYFFIASSVLSTKEHWKLFLNVSVVASVIMSFYTFMQLGGKIQINQGGVRIDGTFGNATYLAVYMLFNIFITLFLSLGLYERGEKGKWYVYAWYGVALVCQFISLYHTATRGAILGLLGGLFITTLCIAIFERNRPMVRKIGIGILVGLTLVVGGFFALRDTSFVTNSPTLSRFSSITAQSISQQGRRFVWPMAWEGFKERPILGWGQENFVYVFNEFYDPRMYAQEPWFDRAHNVLLDWLVTTGIFGFSAYLSLFVAALYLVWKSQNHSLGQKSLLVGLLSAYFFQNLFVFDNLISYIYFFSILGLIHSDSVRTKAEPKWIERIAAHKTISQTAIPTFAAIVVICLVYSLNIQPISASRNIIRGLDSNKSTPEQSVQYFKKVFEADTFGSSEALDQMVARLDLFNNPNISAETRQANAELLVQNLKKIVEQNPDDVRQLLSMGNVINRLGDTTSGLPYLLKAKEISPKKQRVYFEIGITYLTAEKYAEALAEFKTAYELDKNYEEAKVLYVIAALYAKQYDVAEPLIAELLSNPTFFDERLVSVFANTGRATDAVRLLENRVKIDPENPSLVLRLAAGYLSAGQRAKSIAVLQQMLVKFPTYKNEIEYYIKEIQAGRDPSKQ